MSKAPRKGICDPWRVVEPFEPPKPVALPERRRVNLDDIDFDADLRMPETCLFRSRHGSIRVKNKQVASSNDGLRDLVRCLFQILEQEDGPGLFEDINVGFSLLDRKWLEPAAEVTASRLRTTEDYRPAATIWFRQQSFDRGMLGLIKLLNRVQQRPGMGGESILQRWGITPLSR